VVVAERPSGHSFKDRERRSRKLAQFVAEFGIKCYVPYHLLDHLKELGRYCTGKNLDRIAEVAPSYSRSIHEKGKHHRIRHSCPDGTTSPSS
jgi:hypothetical protein